MKLSTKLHAKHTKCFLRDDVMILVIYELNEGVKKIYYHFFEWNNKLITLLTSIPVTLLNSAI